MLTQTSTSDEHAIALRTCLEASGDEHDATTEGNPKATSEAISNHWSEGDSGEGADVLDTVVYGES